ncbi:hypothetical protein T492DRAFT_925961 [Pavlovales sp. CCMP2436]|nr:hypothetical protein T492DRAFT_925961 [Pavlovales sp. CCMP2436]|mmetsp:Transcript_13982/g.35540  ORF Transcript_13982/g.35540 Transcript_13982/m.35540 type:complete len:178 (-) Transcript_13982:403-936(-)
MFHLVPHSPPYLDAPFAFNPCAYAPAQRPSASCPSGMCNMPLKNFPRSLGEMIKLETSNDEAVHVRFEDMSSYDQLEIDCNASQGTLTVRGVDTSANRSATAIRTISLPCEVIKPELVTAETRGGEVVVSIPREAQALKPRPTTLLVGPQKKALKINIIGQGEKQSIFDERAAAMSP